MRLADAVELEAIEQDVQSGFTSLESFGNGLKIADFPEESRMRIDNGVKQNLPFEDGLVSVFVGGIFYGIGAVKDGEMKVIAREA